MNDGPRTSPERLRVAKKLLPGQPGTLKLARRFGQALLCVRYRFDTEGKKRYTTVELIVDHGPAAPRPDRLVGVRVRYEGADRGNMSRSSQPLLASSAQPWQCIPRSGQDCVLST